MLKSLNRQRSLLIFLICYCHWSMVVSSFMHTQFVQNGKEIITINVDFLARLAWCKRAYVIYWSMYQHWKCIVWNLLFDYRKCLARFSRRWQDNEQRLKQDELRLWIMITEQIAHALSGDGHVEEVDNLCPSILITTVIVERTLFSSDYKLKCNTN